MNQIRPRKVPLPTANRTQAVRAMHDTMVERARTSFDVTNMTHFDASMTEFEVIAKFMGISVEEAATLLHFAPC